MIPDKNLVGLAYHFYDEVAKNSAIAYSVGKLNEISYYDGIPLREYRKEDFESKLRSGTPIMREERWLPDIALLMFLLSKDRLNFRRPVT